MSPIEYKTFFSDHIIEWFMLNGNDDDDNDDDAFL